MLQEIVSSKQASLETIKQNRIKQCILFMKNKDTLTALRKWANKTFIISNKYSGLHYIALSINRLIYKKTFNLISSYSLAKKQADIRKRRLGKFFIAKLRDSLILTFDGWKHYTKTFKNFRKILGLANSRRNLSNLSISIHLWKEFITNYQICQLSDSRNQLNLHKENLENELDATSKHLREVKNSNLRLQSIIKAKGKRRLIISFFNGSKHKIHLAWNTWIDWIKKYKIIMRKTNKIVKCWKNKELRQGWRSWTMFVKLQIQKWASVQIETKVKEKKILRAEAKHSKNEYEKNIYEKESEILAVSTKAQKMKKLSNFLLFRGIKSAESEYSVNKAAYFFEIMKKRYFSLKFRLFSLVKNIKVLNIRRGFRDIKTYCLENLKISSLRNMLVNVFKRYGVRLLRSEFDRWYRNTWYCHNTRIQRKLKEENCKILEANSHKALVKTKNREKIFKLLINKSKNIIFNEWKAAAKKIKARKLTSKMLEDKITKRKLRYGLQILAENRECNQHNTRNMIKSNIFSNQSLRKFYFLS